MVPPDLLAIALLALPVLLALRASLGQRESAALKDLLERAAKLESGALQEM